jgi:two-component system response regulator YesN
MYKLLIVEDEELVRNAIVAKLDWISLGFQPVLQAEDGEQAYKIAMEFKPDVVLTDIRMPFMDGLELAERLAKELPDSKIIILSGHDEFDYAQEALKIGVLDYILKPIRSAKLIELMKKVRKLLDNEKAEKEKLAKLKSQLHQSLPLLREKFLNSLINNTVSQREIERKLDFLDIRLPVNSYIACVSEIDNASVLADSKSAEEMELLNFSVSNIISKLIYPKGIAFNDIYNRQVIIFNQPDFNKAAGKHDFYNLLENIRENIEKYLDVTVTIGIGCIVNSLVDLHLSYNDALYAIDYKIVLGSNKIYDIKDLGYRQAHIYFPLEKINSLLSMVKLECMDKVEKCTNDFFDDLLAKRNISPDNIKIILSELINGTQRLLMKVNREEENPCCLDFGIYEEIAKHETLEDIKDVILKFLKRICQFIQNNRNSRNLNIIDKAKQYIIENYYLEELTLNHVAGIVSVSPGYLSILFRKETDETFIEFLTRVRMEKAKELLKMPGVRVYEAAYKVGYSDPHYFSQCFKKYTGLTPSEYR